jgi:hypothetical protein
MSTHISTACATKLADYILGLADFRIYERTGAGYQHMGAIITDAVLQAGLNYRTVVAPRVQSLMLRWPSAYRTSTFATMIRRFGIKDVISWRDDEKPRRIECLTDFFVGQQVDTESQCREWLSDERNLVLLRQVHGIGPKSVDYIKSLVGVPAVAVDRHVRVFVKWSGLSLSHYEDIRQAVCEAAELLSCGYCDLDHAIWRYVSSKSATDARAAAA